jgi:ligand-binding sensor domain-containing protein/signal transduction histidine kinase/CheY-like chemotaxis protein
MQTFTCHMKRSLLILFLSALHAFCQSQPLFFHHLNVEDGLSQNSVLCVTQDSRGFMWLGTRNGLNKYDSRKLTVYKNKPGVASSLSGNYILSLLCDKQQTLWVGTRDGLNKYHAEEDVFERIPVTDPAHPTTNSTAITCLFEDSKGRLWVGTSQTLFLLTNRQQPAFTSFGAAEGFPARGVLCIYEDRNGTIWAGTYGGAVKITATGNRFATTVFTHDPSNAASISDDQVTSIVQDQQGTLWMGTLNGGLNAFDNLHHSFSHFTHAEAGSNSLVNNHIRKLLYNGQDQLWIGTQEGLSVFNTATRSFSSYVNNPWDKNSLSQNSIHSLYKDHTGTIWIGTFFGGVNFHPPYSTDFTVYNNRSQQYRLNNNVISAMVEDGRGNLWIGTEGGGLNYLDRKAGKAIYYTHQPANAGSIGSNLVKTVYKDREGNIWAGTHGGGLNLFNPPTQSFTRYLYKSNDPETLGAEIVCLLEDSKGIFWVGTEISGVKLFRKKDKALLPYPEGTGITTAIGNKSILAFLETSGKNTWVGTSSGLYRITGNQVQLLEEKSSYPYYVNSLLEDAQGNIWVGTYYNGIIVYNSAGRKIASYHQQNGLPDNNVLGILQDNHRKDLWISTGNGLARLDPVARRFTVYTEADGLAGNVFNNNSYYKNNNGELFFGGFNGLSAFYPEQMKENTIVPPVWITGLKLFNKPVEIHAEDQILSKDISFTGKIALRHDQNVFALDFAILSFIKPDKNRYAYQLKGFDKDWNYTSLASASYTNVPPGTYIFMVKGANNDGTWSQPASLQVAVLPPFWKTWWAYSIYVLLFITLAFFIVRFFFLRALLKRNQELTQLKLNFFTNISHEIRTHLSLIIGPAEKLMLTAGHDEQEQQQLRTIKNNSESLLQLVNELMDFRKAETGHLSLHVSGWNIVPFVESVFDSFHDISVSRNIQADFISASPEIEAWFDKEQLEKVFYNLLSNAFKFTPDGGYIGVAIEEKGATVEIRVTDNGRGISKENIERLFDNYFQEDDFGKQNTGYGIGLALSKSIVEMHRGTLAVSSEAVADDQQRTTCFTVVLLKSNAHFNAAEVTLLPAAQEKTTAFFSQQVPALPAPLPSVHETTGARNTILLVEDNVAIRTFIKEALQKNYEIIESGNGLEGLASATETIPDLIISDVMMPEMDGLAFCSHIKTDARTSHIPVILLTAKTAVTHQISGLQTGADIYLTKPFSIQVLELQIRNLLASRERLWKQFQQQLSLTPVDADDSNEVAGSPAAPVPVTAALHPMDEAFLQSIIQMVEEHMEDPSFGIALLSKKAAMSQPVLFKKIKAITGMAANDFVKSLRLKKATELLQENRYTVYEIAYMVGYESSKYFSREFKKQFGKTPSEYSKP